LDADLARFESDLKEQHAKEAGFSDYESKGLSVLIICLSSFWMQAFSQDF